VQDFPFSNVINSESIQNRGESMEDKKLLELLHKNPSVGLEQLMNQYTNLVYTVVKSKLKDSYCISTDIEDCVADVFIKFYTGLSDYNPTIASIKSYLCVIARNHAINVAKKRSFQIIYLSTMKNHYYSWQTI
jgi:DNA-directed RNA polymerase specialized sigma24 family protein